MATLSADRILRSLIAPAAVLLLASSPRPARSQPPPDGVSQILIAGRSLGWEVKPAVLLGAKDDVERRQRAQAIAEFLVRQRFSNAPYGGELAHQAASIAAALGDIVAPDATGNVLDYQIYHGFDGNKLLINKFYRDKTIHQLVGKFEPTLSGWSDGAGASAATWTGLTLWMRGVASLQDHKRPFFIYKQYVGGSMVEKPEARIEADYGALSPIVRRTVDIERRHEGGAVEVRKEKETDVLYSAPSLITTLIQIGDELSPGAVLRKGLGGMDPTWSPPCSSKDLAALFPDPPTRHQGDRGTCHVFATIGLLESALNRAYGVDIPLSEDDLASSISGAKVLPKADNGGNVEVDYFVAKLAGVATRRAVPYPGEWRPLPKGFEGKVLENARRLTGEAAPPPAVPAQPQASPAALEQERRDVRAALLPFTLDSALRPPLAPDLGVRQVIINHLCEERPVAVGLNVVWLPEWDQPDPGKTPSDNPVAITLASKGHAVVITGFEEYPPGSGRHRYKVRNSWGGENPYIYDEDLWRVISFSAVRVDKRATPPALLRLASGR
ncbi:MAG: hypothetical protein HY926_04260 [Elusimicrobia bacterium]|nr:hypothetical protein [Elusimicrobiota bacterium]